MVVMGDPCEKGDPREAAASFDALPAIVWAFDGPEHRVVAANRAARASIGGRRVLGLPARQVISDPAGQHLFEQRLFEQLDQVYATGEPSHGREWRALAGSGDGAMEEAPFDITLVPRFDKEGVVCGVLAHGASVKASAGVNVGINVGESEQQSYDVAVSLQRAALSAGLPVLPQVWLAARYLVARDELNAGGDWVDAVALGRGRVALSVGDVVGHGVAAVAVMTQLRTVLTEALLDGEPAVEALARLNRYATRVPAARAATACLAVIDPTAGEVEYGGFGHPAPLVVGDAGRTRFLPISPSRPLGMGQEPSALRSARLTPGEVLLLYSDGLVQRPGRSLQDGMEQLAAVASTAMWAAPAQQDADSLADRVCGRTVERLTRSGYADDITLLGAELRVEPHRRLALELPADGVWLRGIRRALDEWLHAVGARGEDVPAVHLAVVEAATNCVEHAYREAGGWMWLDVMLDSDGRLRATVTDRGGWRSPPEDTDYRGRGMRLINSLMESVEVHSSDQGTIVTMARTLRHPTVFLPARRAPPATSSGVDFGTEMRQGPPPCLIVSGPVDMATAGALRNRISELSRGGLRPIDVDLTAVTQLASAGVQVLYDCARTAEGAALVRLLAPVHCPARFVLELTGLDEVLELLPEWRSR
jgi:anti-anti-sigma factor